MTANDYLSSHSIAVQLCASFSTKYLITNRCHVRSSGGDTLMLWSAAV